MGIELRTGTFQSTLDEKGRVNIPARVRDLYAGSELIITQGMQLCVWLMTPEIWEQFSRKLMNSEAVTEEEYLDIQYQYILPAQVVEIDRAHRIAIPPPIRRYAGLSRDCLVMSAENHLEIWDAEYFYAYLKESRHRERVEKMGSKGLFKVPGQD